MVISDTEGVWATRAVAVIEKMEDEPGTKKVVKLDSEIKKIRKMGLKTMKKLRLQVPHPLCILELPFSCSVRFSSLE